MRPNEIVLSSLVRAFARVIDDNLRPFLASCSLFRCVFFSVWFHHLLVQFDAHFILVLLTRIVLFLIGTFVVCIKWHQNKENHCHLPNDFLFCHHFHWNEKGNNKLWIRLGSFILEVIIHSPPPSFRPRFLHSACELGHIIATEQQHQRQQKLNRPFTIRGKMFQFSNVFWKFVDHKRVLAVWQINNDRKKAISRDFWRIFSSSTFFNCWQCECTLMCMEPFFSLSVLCDLRSWAHLKSKLCVLPFLKRQIYSLTLSFFPIKFTNDERGATEKRDRMVAEKQWPNKFVV